MKRLLESHLILLALVFVVAALYLGSRFDQGWIPHDEGLLSAPDRGDRAPHHFESRVLFPIARVAVQISRRATDRCLHVRAISVLAVAFHILNQFETAETASASPSAFPGTATSARPRGRRELEAARVRLKLELELTTIVVNIAGSFLPEKSAPGPQTRTHSRRASSPASLPWASRPKPGGRPNITDLPPLSKLCDRAGANSVSGNILLPCSDPWHSTARMRYVVSEFNREIYVRTGIRILGVNGSSKPA